MRPRSLIPHAPGVAFVAATLGFGVGNVLAKVVLDRGVNALELLRSASCSRSSASSRCWRPPAGSGVSTETHGEKGRCSGS